MTANEIVAAIEAELARLDAVDSEHNCNGIAVYLDDDLPPGVVRVDGHGGGASYVVASEYLAELKEITEFENIHAEDADATGWSKAVDAAMQIGIDPEGDARDLYQLEEVWANDEETPEQGCGRATVYKLQTNAGTRYAGVADSVNQCPIHEYRSNNCEFRETLEEAQAECVGGEMVFNSETGKYECVESQDD